MTKKHIETQICANVCLRIESRQDFEIPMHYVKPNECSAYPVGGVTVEHVTNLCRRSVTRAHVVALTGIFRQGDSASAFRTWYSETAIGRRIRIVQNSTEMSYMVVFLLCHLTSDMDKSVNAFRIITVEPVRWRRRGPALHIQIRILLHTTWHRIDTQISSLWCCIAIWLGTTWTVTASYAQK